MNAPSSSTWEAGQEIILRKSRFGRAGVDGPATITRVGRKYVYVEVYGREVPFDVVTGFEKTGTNYPARIFTPAALAAHDRRDAAHTRVRDLTRDYGWTGRLSVETLERIANLIEHDGALAPTTDLVPAEDIEGKVGAERHPVLHYGRAVTAEQRVYILHSGRCRNSGIDLRSCEFSRALGRGVQPHAWAGYEDLPVILDVQAGVLVPTGLVPGPEANR